MQRTQYNALQITVFVFNTIFFSVYYSVKTSVIFRLFILLVVVCCFFIFIAHLTQKKFKVAYNITNKIITSTLSQSP